MLVFRLFRSWYILMDVHPWKFEGSSVFGGFAFFFSNTFELSFAEWGAELSHSPALHTHMWQYIWHRLRMSLLICWGLLARGRTLRCDVSLPVGSCYIASSNRPILLLRPFQPKQPWMWGAFAGSSQAHGQTWTTVGDLKYNPKDVSVE
jgi:hypothetical protein